jgi:spermidine synthase
MHSHLWIEERFEDFYGMRFKVEKVLFSGKSPFQTVDVVETRGHGRMLLNDGLIMVTERDEHVYHDMIAHVPLFVHPNPKRVLVIGGGDGGTAREALRHPGVEQVVMVEIDKMVVDACREFIPQTSKELDNPRMELIIGDGVEYVKKATEKFDVILVDSTDPIGPAQPLFGEEFYRDIFNLLTDDGIVVAQGESPFFHPEVQASMLELLGKIFPIVRSYNFSNLTYPGGLWSFSFASKKYHPLRDFNESRVHDSKLEFDYYNAELHRGSFALPSFMLKKVARFFKD